MWCLLKVHSCRAEPVVTPTFGFPFQFFDPLARNCVRWELRCKAVSPRLPLLARRRGLLLATVEFVIEFERAVLKTPRLAKRPSL